MSRIPSASPEVGVIRTYVDWLVGLPWTTSTDDNLDIKEAAKILDEDHYGLEKVKERILEYLAVRALADTIRSPILCFVGPPGVGKTSLGKSIARAMGRKFVRMSLGGVHDEAEIRGHRRTYIGALPGRIIQSIKTAGTNNPVFMLDEVDKLGMDFRGDPSSALLEVLDPEQNNTFQDNYLEVPFDLSQGALHHHRQPARPDPARRCATGWRSSSSPATPSSRRSRSAKRFLVPKQLDEPRPDGRSTSRSPTRPSSTLVQAYTHEAGVRNLEREIANVMRKVARQVAEGRKRKTVVDNKKLVEFLGPPRFEYGELEAEDQTGAATGLVVTEVGGDVVAVEVTKMEGKEDFILTGQLGDVMQESARAALSWIRANADRLGIEREVFEKNTLHIHVPAGAIPKDGPSAGHHDGHGDGERAHRDPRPQGRGDDRRDHPPRPGPPDRRPQEQDPRRAPVGRADRDPAEEEREGPPRHPRGDPQADQARPRRLDGPGARGGAPAQAAGRSSSRRPGSGGGRGRSGARPRSRAPARLPGRPAARPSRRAAEPAGAGSVATAARRGAAPPRPTEGDAVDYRDYYADPRRAADRLARPRSRRPSASSPGSTTRTATRRRRGRAPLQGDQRGQRGPRRPREAEAVRRARARTGRTYARAGGRPGGDPFGPGGPFAGFGAGGGAAPGRAASASSSPATRRGSPTSSGRSSPAGWPARPPAPAATARRTAAARSRSRGRPRRQLDDILAGMGGIGSAPAGAGLPPAAGPGPARPAASRPTSR